MINEHVFEVSAWSVCIYTYSVHTTYAGYEYV